ncbi:MAG: 2-oxoacid:acceptor oxidoreductase family protein [Nitrospirae bacterium]|nr:2-oxoacid:acceptor oxidoreductase family protein [Nitrospirota bacterium]
MNSKNLQLIVAGFGGQGVLFTGKLLTYAAMLEGREVTCFPSYGAEIRGGTANCTVIISDEMIGSPVVNKPDVLLIMNEASMERFVPRLKSGGLLIMNSSLIKNLPKRQDLEVLQINATGMAEELGSSQIANMIMIGALIAKTGIISVDTVFNALGDIIPERKKGIIPVNQTAIKKGLEEIRIENAVKKPQTCLPAGRGRRG